MQPQQRDDLINLLCATDDVPPSLVELLRQLVEEREEDRDALRRAQAALDADVEPDVRAAALSQLEAARRRLGIEPGSSS